jgi:hypothetical protein
MCGSNLPPGVTGMEDYFDDERPCSVCDAYASGSDGLCYVCRENQIADEEYDDREF